MSDTTVTMPLQDFDEYRRDSENFFNLRRHIALCFEYSSEKRPMPPRCKECEHTHKTMFYYNVCKECFVYENFTPPIETLSVDVSKLINVTKEYALFDKFDVETNINLLTILRE